MPDGVLEAQALPDVEDHAERIDHAAGDDQPDGNGGKVLRDRHRDDDAAPAHGKVEQDRQPVVAARKEALERNAADRRQPDRHEHEQDHRIVDAALEKRRVGCGDQDEDRRMVEAAQQPLRAGFRPDVVGKGNGQTEQQSQPIDPGGSDLAEACREADIENQRGDADQRQHDADAVDDTVGHDLVEIILSSEPEKLGHAILAAPCQTKMVGRVPSGKRG